MIELRFQSTHPCGVRHRHILIANTHSDVSIHAPLRGATDGLQDSDSPHVRFNPRTPAGCDTRRREAACRGHMFQSTHPCGVRQDAFPADVSRCGVSIHAPLRGATFSTT